MLGLETAQIGDPKLIELLGLVIYVAYVGVVVKWLFNHASKTHPSPER
jgi:hypothetical protein